MLLPTKPLPVVLDITEARRGLQIIRVDQIDALFVQLLPHPIPKTHRPRRQFPIPDFDALGMRNSNLTPQAGQLRRVEDTIRIQERAELRREIGRGDGRHQRGDIAKGAIERRDGPIIEVIPLLDRLHLLQRRIPRPDHRHSPIQHRRAALVDTRQVAALPQRLQRADHIRPGGVARRLDIDEEVHGLAAVAIEDAVPRLRRRESADRVLALEHGEDGFDVEGFEGARARQRRRLVPDVEASVGEPDVGFDADAAVGQGGVEGHGAPVVVVAVDAFLYGVEGWLE